MLSPPAPPAPPVQRAAGGPAHPQTGAPQPAGQEVRRGTVQGSGGVRKSGSCAGWPACWLPPKTARTWCSQGRSCRPSSLWVVSRRCRKGASAATTPGVLATLPRRARSHSVGSPGCWDRAGGGSTRGNGHTEPHLGPYARLVPQVYVQADGHCGGGLDLSAAVPYVHCAVQRQKISLQGPYKKPAKWQFCSVRSEPGQRSNAGWRWWRPQNRPANGQSWKTGWPPER